MFETRRGVSWRVVRSWAGEHVGILLVVIVTLYLLGFFLYHAFVPVDSLIWEETAHYSVGDSCELLVEYPSRLSLDTSDALGYPLTARMWYLPVTSPDTLPLSVSCSANLDLDSYSVQFGPLGEGLEFIDQSGDPVPATVGLDLAMSESAAVPARIYVRRAPSPSLDPVPLAVRVQAIGDQGSGKLLPTLLRDPAPPIVRPESEREARWRHFLEALFNPGPLQWMFTAVAGIVGVWEVYKDLQQRREERREKITERRRTQHERIRALRDEASAERAFHTYVALRSEFGDDPSMMGELHNAFRPDWLPYLRQQLGRYLRAGQFHDAWEHVDRMEWEWRQGTDERTRLAIKALIRHLRDPSPSVSRGNLYQVLEGFRSVGLEATGPIVDWLIKVQPDRRVTREVLFRKGGAGGRHLLLKWAERDAEFRHLLRTWEQEELPPIRHDRGTAGLWARERGESQLIQQGVERLGLDFNPFGPEKAEQDPQLPDLFYRLSPVWEEVAAPQPSILIAPPGCGRSALIWMLRYESGLVGASMEDVFTVFVPLYPFASSQELGQVLRTSISTALCQALVRDPYALLGLEETEQRGLADLLLSSAGGLGPLLRQLRGAGLPLGDPDGQLLQEALAVVARSGEVREEAVQWDMPRFHPYGMEYTFLLMDVAFQNGDMTGLLLESLFGRWLPSLAPRHVVPKVFLPAAPDDCPITPMSVKWDQGSLSGMLRHRLRRAGLVLQEDRPALTGWVEEMDDPDSVLIETAKGCPAQLIGLGNRLMRRIAQPRSLAGEEFLSLLAVRTQDDA